MATDVGRAALVEGAIEARVGRVIVVAVATAAVAVGGAADAVLELWLAHAFRASVCLAISALATSRMALGSTHHSRSPSHEHTRRRCPASWRRSKRPASPPSRRSSGDSGIRRRWCSCRRWECTWKHRRLARSCCLCSFRSTAAAHRGEQGYQADGRTDVAIRVACARATVELAVGFGADVKVVAIELGVAVAIVWAVCIGRA